AELSPSFALRRVGSLDYKRALRMANTYKQVFKRQRELLEKAPSEARNLAGILFAEEVVPRTPVDTGLARGNWHADINQPTIASLLVYDKTARNTPRAIRSAIKNFPKDGKLIISNWLPYIERLEAGYSRQAPSGMARLSALVVSRFATTFLLNALGIKKNAIPGNMTNP